MQPAAGAAAASTRHELFVYYRVAPQHESALVDAVCRMQTALREAQPGLDARLLRRVEPGADTITWMEIYRLPAAADVPASIGRIGEAARPLAAWLEGERHVEHFLPCAS